jgi:CheY-like chemotaxis protein
METVPATRLLIVEGDRHIRVLMQEVLSEMGYGCSVAANPEQALRVLKRQPVDLIVTDAFSRTCHDILASPRPFLQLAHALPVVMCTDWPLLDCDLAEAGFAARVPKPFALDDLVTTVAESLKQPFTAAQYRQAESVHHFLAALSAWDCDALGALLAMEVALYPWLMPPYPAAHRAAGRAAVLDYVREMARYFGPVRLLNTHLFPCPLGLAVRFLAQWRLSDNALEQQSVCLCFQFDNGGLITQIGHPRQGVFPRMLLEARGEQRPSEP